jgi:hypothetical protein
MMGLVLANTALALTNVSVNLELDFSGQFALNPMTIYSSQSPNRLPDAIAVSAFSSPYYLFAVTLAQLFPLVLLFLSLSALHLILFLVRPTKIF